MISEKLAAQNTRNLFLKAADVNWNPDAGVPEDIRVVSLRHRGVDSVVLKLRAGGKPKGFFGNLFSRRNEKTETVYRTVITVADGQFCMEQNGRKTNISLTDIQGIDVSKPSRNREACLQIETGRVILRCGNGLPIESLRWLGDRLVLEAAGLVWKPIFNVGRRTTLKTVSQDFDTYMQWPHGSHPIFEFFFDQAPKQASELINAIRAEDFEVVRCRADWLKSSCAVIGATYLSGLCQRIEVHADNKEVDGICALAQHFAKEFNSVLRHLCKLSGRLASEAGLVEEPAADTDIERAQKSARILIVEDSMVNQEIASSLLSLAGHQTTIASHGGEALEILEKGSFDLILMDCQMPGLSGIEATKQIRANEIQRMSGRTPIVALTANALKDDRKSCLAANMDDYLSKPYSPHELLSIVDRWINPVGSADLPEVREAV